METIHVAMEDRLLRIVDADGAPELSVTELDVGRLECVAGPADDPERLYVGTVEAGCLRSSDGGRSVEAVEIGGDRITALTSSPHDPRTVYAGTEPSRLYRSTDAGDSWDRIEGIADLPSEPEWFFPPRPETHHVRWIAVDPFDPDRLYVGIEAGAFLYSTDGGETWHERPEGARRDNHSLATHPDREGLVYAAAGDGFARSTDGGERWEQPQTGLDHRYCWSVAVDPGDPDAVLVSSASGASRAHRHETADAHLYRMRDEAAWERVDDEGFPTGEGVVRAVLATGDDPGVVYGVTNRGLYRSEAFGDDWHRMSIEWPEALTEQAPRGMVVRS